MLQEAVPRDPPLGLCWTRTYFRSISLQGYCESRCKATDHQIFFRSKDILTLERVQRKAARFCLQNFTKTTSVTDMLSDLKWDTLETRRKKNRLTLMYKLSHNLVDINTEEHLIPNSELRTRNSHAFKYRMPKVSKDVFKFSFFPRSITEWNSLPADLVNCKSLSDFKLNLGKHVKCLTRFYQLNKCRCRCRSVN